MLTTSETPWRTLIQMLQNGKHIRVTSGSLSMSAIYRSQTKSNTTENTLSHCYSVGGEERHRGGHGTLPDKPMASQWIGGKIRIRDTYVNLLAGKNTFYRILTQYILLFFAKYKKIYLPLISSNFSQFLCDNKFVARKIFFQAVKSDFQSKQKQNLFSYLAQTPSV